MGYSVEIGNGKLSLILFSSLIILAVGIVSAYDSGEQPYFFGHSVDEIAPGTFPENSDLVFDSESTVNISGDLMANGIKRTFIVWGTNADLNNGADTDLIYPGIGFNKDFNADGAGYTSLCLRSGDPGEDPGSSTHRDNLLQMATHPGNNNVPPNIPTDRVIKCGVHSTKRVVLTLWGTNQCPDGWGEAYHGYAMGDESDENGAADRICVISGQEFDDSIQDTTTSRSRMAATVLHNIDGTTGYTGDTFLQCAVCLKS